MLPLTKTEPWGGNPVRQGIEFDAIGRRVAYHFLRRHPGDVTDPASLRAPMAILLPGFKGSRGGSCHQHVARDFPEHVFSHTAQQNVWQSSTPGAANS